MSRNQQGTLMDGSKESSVNRLPLMSLSAIAELHRQRAQLPQADLQCLNRCVAVRLERFAAQASLLHVARTLFLQSAPPRTPIELVKSILLCLFILSGLLVFGKQRFVEILFDDTPMEDRVQFVNDLLGSPV